MASSVNSHERSPSPAVGSSNAAKRSRDASLPADIDAPPAQRPRLSSQAATSQEEVQAQLIAECGQFAASLQTYVDRFSAEPDAQAKLRRIFIDQVMRPVQRLGLLRNAPSAASSVPVPPAPPPAGPTIVGARPAITLTPLGQNPVSARPSVPQSAAPQTAPNLPAGEQQRVMQQRMMQQRAMQQHAMQLAARNQSMSTQQVAPYQPNLAQQRTMCQIGAPFAAAAPTVGMQPAASARPQAQVRRPVPAVPMQPQAGPPAVSPRLQETTAQRQSFAPVYELASSLVAAGDWAAFKGGLDTLIQQGAGEFVTPELVQELAKLPVRGWAPLAANIAHSVRKWPTKMPCHLLFSIGINAPPLLSVLSDAGVFSVLAALQPSARSARLEILQTLVDAGISVRKLVTLHVLRAATEELEDSLARIFSTIFGGQSSAPHDVLVDCLLFAPWAYEQLSSPPETPTDLCFNYENALSEHPVYRTVSDQAEAAAVQLWSWQKLGLCLLEPEARQRALVRLDRFVMDHT